MGMLISRCLYEGRYLAHARRAGRVGGRSHLSDLGRVGGESGERGRSRSRKSTGNIRGPIYAARERRARGSRADLGGLQGSRARADNSLGKARHSVLDEFNYSSMITSRFSRFPKSFPQRHATVTAALRTPGRQGPYEV